jgi:ribosome-binding factor A
MNSPRINRIASRIRFLIGSVIQREMSDPRIGFVTILRVEPTPDLKEAKVYFSVLGDQTVRSRTCHAIEQSRGFIQRAVGKNLETRHTPRLRFILDETQDKLTRFETLIEKAVQEDQDSRNGEETGQEESEEE